MLHESVEPFSFCIVIDILYTSALDSNERISEGINMCGRYNFGQSLVEKMKVEMSTKEYEQISFGEVRPGNHAAVKMQDGYHAVKWGVNVDWSKRLIINSRLESVKDKVFFKTDYLTNRCIIFANSYYEWDDQKTKYEISTEEDILLMAGFIMDKGKRDEFVILTEGVQRDIRHIHNRMPVILSDKEANDYLSGLDISIFVRYHEMKYRIV